MKEYLGDFRALLLCNRAFRLDWDLHPDHVINSEVTEKYDAKCVIVPEKRVDQDVSFPVKYSWSTLRAS